MANRNEAEFCISRHEMLSVVRRVEVMDQNENSCGPFTGTRVWTKNSVRLAEIHQADFLSFWAIFEFCWDRPRALLQYYPVTCLSVQTILLDFCHINQEREHRELCVNEVEMASLPKNISSAKAGIFVFWLRCGQVTAVAEHDFNSHPGPSTALQCTSSVTSREQW